MEKEYTVTISLEEYKYLLERRIIFENFELFKTKTKGLVKKYGELKKDYFWKAEYKGICINEADKFTQEVLEILYHSDPIYYKSIVDVLKKKVDDEPCKEE